MSDPIKREYFWMVSMPIVILLAFFCLIREGCEEQGFIHINQAPATTQPIGK